MIRLTLPPLCLLFLFGCAAVPPQKHDARDPWQRMNRATYAFNDKFDKAIARPVARGYQKVTPGFVQTGIRNVFDNIDTPVVMANDLLQGQFKPFLSDTGRLLVNTIMGIGGMFDLATPMGLQKNDRDFGQTLGKWGVHPGPYLVIPLVGPSDLRDTVGKVADTYSNPRTYISNNYWKYGSYLLDAVDERARLLPADQLLDGAFDPYAFMRNAYLQRRAFMVNGGQSKSEEEQEEKLLDEATGEEQPPAPTKPQAPPPTPKPQTPPH